MESPDELLRRLGLSQYAPSFAENAIDAELLPSLTDDDLRTLGVAPLGHRKKILAAIAALPHTPPAHAQPTEPFAHTEPAQPTPAESSPPGPSPPPALDALPPFVAWPLAEVLHETADALALWAACDAVELSLKLLVMAGLAEREALPAPLLRALQDRIELPTLGKWLGMAQAVARHAPSSSVLRLAPTVASLEALLAGGDPDEGLLALRNRLAHGGPVPRAEAARLRALWQPRVLRWATASLAWLAPATWIVVDAEGAPRRLHGREAGEVLGDIEGTGLLPGSACVRIEGRTLSLGPLATFDLEEKAPRVYVRRGEVRLQYLRLSESGGLCDSDADAFEQFRTRFLAVEAAPRAFTIREFHEELRRESDRRVGREPELATVVSAARAGEAPFLWVSGPAGIGKSNLMASAMVDLVESPPEGALVLAFRFRAGDDRCGRGPFLTFLRERLEASDALADEPDEPDEDQDEDDASPRPARRSAPKSNDPAQQVQALLARLATGRRVLLLLDGLDEVLERDPRFVSDVLLQLRGPAVGLLAAGRPDRGLHETFVAAGATLPFPEGLPAMREDDVRALLLERSAPLRKRLLARDHERGGAIRNAFIERVAHRSEGLPIYVNYVVGDMNAGRISPENPDALPASLHAYHDELLRRASVGDLQTVTTPILVLLALAREPLTTRELSALLRRRGVLEREAPTLIERALSTLSSMLRRAPDPDGHEGFTLFHHSLRTHVLTSPEVGETVTATRTALADASLAPAGDEAEVYLLRCGVQHLIDAARGEDAVVILTDFARVMARLRRLEATGRAADEWYADWDRVRDAVAPLSATGRAWWDFARACRHHFARPGWEPWRVLFQCAMDHADDSPVTVAAEAFLAGGGWEQPWLRWINRPARLPSSAPVCVFAGHKNVEGIRQLRDGRMLSWSGWDPEENHVIYVWDPRIGRAIARRDTDGQSIEFVEPHRSGDLLAVWRYRALRMDPDTLSTIRECPLPSAAVGAVLLRNDRLAIVTWRELVLWDHGGSTEAITVPLIGAQKRVYETRSGHVLIVHQGTGGGGWIHDATTGEQLLSLTEHPKGLRGVLELSDGAIVRAPPRTFGYILSTA